MEYLLLLNFYITPVLDSTLTGTLTYRNRRVFVKNQQDPKSKPVSNLGRSETDPGFGSQTL